LVCLKRLFEEVLHSLSSIYGLLIRGSLSLFLSYKFFEYLHGSEVPDDLAHHKALLFLIIILLVNLICGKCKGQKQEEKE